MAFGSRRDRLLNAESGIRMVVGTAHRQWKIDEWGFEPAIGLPHRDRRPWRTPIMPSAVVASLEPAVARAAHKVEWVARAHDVSILITIGAAAWRGACPRANTSITSMRPPQHGQGRG